MANRAKHSRNVILNTDFFNVLLELRNLENKVVTLHDFVELTVERQKRLIQLNISILCLREKRQMVQAGRMMMKYFSTVLKQILVK